MTARWTAARLARALRQLTGAATESLQAAQNVPPSAIDTSPPGEPGAGADSGSIISPGATGTPEWMQPKGSWLDAEASPAGSVLISDGVDLSDWAKLKVGQLDPEASTDGQVPTSDGVGGIAWEDPPGAGGGEANTASNVGTGGVGVFKIKSGVDLQFKKLNAGSSKVTITDDTGNDEVDVDVAEANLTLGNLGGTLGIAKGGTGQTAAVAAFDALAPGTTKGDVIAHDGTDHVRLAVGTDGQVLQADSASSAGVKWAAAGGGGQSAVLGFSAGAATISKGSTDYVGLGSAGVASAEANAEFYVPVAGTLRNLRTYVSTNDTGAAGNTVTIRKNGASTSLLTTYNSGETGLKSDTSNTATVAAGDRIAIQVVNQGSGGGSKNLVLETVALELA